MRISDWSSDVCSSDLCAENLSAYGAYIMAPADSERQVTLIASGSEVQIALEAQKLLRDEGISSAVVSMPSWELFEQQPAPYRDEVLGPGTLHIALEAAGPVGWAARKRVVKGKRGAVRVD